MTKEKPSRRRRKVRPQYVVMRRLKVNEKIHIGDWCCDPRSEEPVRVLYEDKYSVISETHHPHYRIKIVSG